MVFFSKLFNSDPKAEGSHKLYFIKEGSSYTVVGLGSEYSRDIIIPSIHKGLSVTKIGNYAFSDCRSLTSITISNSVTIIGEYAFTECSSLTNIIISDSVTTIGGGAFYGCGSLTSVTIPNSVTKIGICAFSQLASVTFNGTISQWYAIKKDDKWCDLSTLKVVHCTDGDI